MHLDLEAQFQQLKEQCNFSQAEKFSLQLTGERHTTALVGLEWKTTNGFNSYQFVLERSLADTFHFEQIREVWAESIAGFKDIYRVPDGNSYDDISYYRLRLILRTGDYIYSNIAAVKGYDNRSFFAFPNPALSTVTINFIAKEQGAGALTVYDASGRLVSQESLRIQQGVNQKNINVGRLKKGIYTMQLKIADQTTDVYKFIKD